FNDALKTDIDDKDYVIHQSRFAALQFGEPYLKDFPYQYSRLSFLEGLRVFPADDLASSIDQLYPLLKKMRKNHAAFMSVIAKLSPEEREQAIRAAHLA